MLLEENTRNDNQELKLDELSKKANVAKKTIHYYLNKGLLPPAKKIHARLAVYNQNHLRLLKLIQLLKNEAHLPLTIIEEVFKKRSYDAKTIEEIELIPLMKGIDSSESLFRYIETYNGKKANIETIPPGFQQELFEKKLISNSQGKLDKQEFEIALTLLRARELGLPLEIFDRFEKAIDEIVSTEKQILIEQIKPDSDHQSTIDHLLEINKLIDNFISHKKSNTLLKHFSQTFQEAPISIQSLNKNLYIPSQAFLEKQKIIEQISNLYEKRDEGKLNTIDIIESFIIIGNYAEAKKEAENLLENEKENPDALIALGTANIFLNESLDVAIEQMEKAASLRPGNARILSYCAISYLFQGTRIGGIFSSAQLLKKSFDAFNEAIAIHPESPREELEILLMKGRAYSILPTPLEKVNEGIESLEKLLEIIENNTDEELNFPIPSFREIITINAYFYLGEAYLAKKNHSKSQSAFKRVLLKDPASNFGANAFEKLN